MKNFFGKTILIQRKEGKKTKSQISAEIGDKRYLRVPAFKETDLSLSSKSTPSFYFSFFGENRSRWPQHSSVTVLLTRIIITKKVKLYKPKS